MSREKQKFLDDLKGISDADGLKKDGKTIIVPKGLRHQAREKFTETNKRRNRQEERAEKDNELSENDSEEIRIIQEIAELEKLQTSFSTSVYQSTVLPIIEQKKQELAEFKNRNDHEKKDSFPASVVKSVDKTKKTKEILIEVAQEQVSTEEKFFAATPYLPNSVQNSMAEYAISYLGGSAEVNDFFIDIYFKKGELPGPVYSFLNGLEKQIKQDKASVLDGINLSGDTRSKLVDNILSAPISVDELKKNISSSLLSLRFNRQGEEIDGFLIKELINRGILSSKQLEVFFALPATGVVSWFDYNYRPIADHLLDWYTNDYPLLLILQNKKRLTSAEESELQELEKKQRLLSGDFKNHSNKRINLSVFEQEYLQKSKEKIANLAQLAEGLSSCSDRVSQIALASSKPESFSSAFEQLYEAEQSLLVNYRQTYEQSNEQMQRIEKELDAMNLDLSQDSLEGNIIIDLVSEIKQLRQQYAEEQTKMHNLSVELNKKFHFPDCGISDKALSTIKGSGIQSLMEISEQLEKLFPSQKKRDDREGFWEKIYTAKQELQDRIKQENDKIQNNNYLYSVPGLNLIYCDKQSRGQTLYHSIDQIIKMISATLSEDNPANSRLNYIYRECTEQGHKIEIEQRQQQVKAKEKLDQLESELRQLQSERAQLNSKMIVFHKEEKLNFIDQSINALNEQIQQLRHNVNDENDKITKKQQVIHQIEELIKEKDKYDIK